MRVFAVLALAVFLLAGCSGSDPTPAKTVKVHDNSFDPTTVNIVKGETIAWVSEGKNPHTVTIHGVADMTLDPGATVQHTFKEAGEFHVHCDIHPSMEMTVKVA
ncbi:MAG: plastocyanin [Thermoplasmata archaeon]|jgi:plastocyanin|nr:plastocyanin [Thermoplasmata archaeon]